MRLARPVSTLPAPSSTNMVTPLPRKPGDRLAPAHHARDLLDEAPRISSGSVIGAATTLATSGTTGAIDLRPRRAPRAIASAAGAISAQWNGALTGSRIARLAPLPLAISTARSTAAMAPETTTWPAPLSLATLADLAFRGGLGNTSAAASSRGRAAPPSRRRRPGRPPAWPDRGCGEAAPRRRG